MAGPGFTNLFGGNTVYQANPSFLSLNPLTASVQLSWPIEQSFSPPNVADIIEVNASTTGLTIQFDDATIPSTGYTTLINNIGANTITVENFSGGTLATIASGEVWQLYLADNTTQNGTWRVFQYGAGTSSANAAALAGAGLIAITTTLNEQMAVSAQSTDYVSTVADRAKVIEWTGGTGTITLPDVSTLAPNASGWFVVIKNSGNGIVTVSPPTGTIDGSASLAFDPEQSAFLVTDGTNYFTIGYGQQLNSIFDFIQISLAGDFGDVVLTGADLNRVSYRFIGALAGNVNVIVPNTIQQYWVDNETTGAFSLTVKTAAGTGVTISQGSRNILYCDGTNVLVAVTFGSTGFPNGSAAAPSIAFAASPSTGFYSPGSNSVAAATNGVERFQIDSAGHFTFEGPDTDTSPGFSFVQSAAGGGITVAILSSFGSGAATPLLALASSAAGGFATLSIAGNAGVPGTSDLSIFHNGSDLSGNISVNSAGPLKFLTGSQIRGTVSNSGVWDIFGSPGNVGISISTAAYTFGNVTDNPNFSFIGTGVASFSVTPTAPTQSPGTNTTQLATTAFVQAAVTGLATTSFVTSSISAAVTGLAPLASPTFIGTPAAPTATAGTATTQIATTAFVNPGATLTGGGPWEEIRPSGAIEIWGTTTYTTDSGVQSVSFTPFSFPNGIHIVQIQTVAAAIGWDTWVVAGSETTAGFEFNDDAPAAHTVTINWRAIGH